MASPKFRTTPSTPPTSAVNTPIRRPPNAAANSTAGKYGVKWTSGLQCPRPQRASATTSRQATAKARLRPRRGGDMPCQPLRNSSISFPMRSPVAMFVRKTSGSQRCYACLACKQSSPCGEPAGIVTVAAPSSVASAIWHQIARKQGHSVGRLDGKVAVITGATSGIGLRTAEVFVAEGAKIVIAGRRAVEGEALAKKLGDACVFRQTDVTQEDQMQALIGAAIDR